VHHHSTITFQVIVTEKQSIVDFVIS